MNQKEILKRIAELESLIAPLADELKQLRRKLSSTKGGQASAQVRRENAKARRKRIQQKLRDNIGDLYKHQGGLVRKIAKEEGLSERTVSTYLAEIKPEINERQFG